MSKNPLNSQNALVIACAMLEDEVNLAMRSTGCTLPVEWGERRLHEQPDRMRVELNDMIAKHPEAETILLAYGLCGTGMDGVGSATSTLVVPRFDDCVWMLLCRDQNRRPQMDNRSLYCFGGMMAGEGTVLHGFEYAVKKYGKAKALKIYRQVFKNYHSITLLDTGAYSLDETRPVAKAFADDLELELAYDVGTVRVLEKLFSGNWDSEFCLARPGEKFSREQFCEAS